MKAFALAMGLLAVAASAPARAECISWDRGTCIAERLGPSPSLGQSYPNNGTIIMGDGYPLDAPRPWNGNARSWQLLVLSQGHVSLLRNLTEHECTEAQRRLFPIGQSLVPFTTSVEKAECFQ